MASGYRHLTFDQRAQIYALRNQGYSFGKIAKELGVHRSTIAREIKRNLGQKGYRYKQAQAKADQRRSDASKRPKKMTEEMISFIETKLYEKWSPEQIAGWMKKHEGFVGISHEAIYQLIRIDRENGGSLYKQLRRRGKKYNKRLSKTSGRGCIPNRVDIDERPSIVDEKSRIGDWEMDTIIGALHQSAIVSMVERKSKLTKLLKVSRKTAEEVFWAIISKLSPIRRFVLTLTYDNGKEFAWHEKIALLLQAKCYFAKPYHSWERGVNEHTNGLVRQYFPKGLFDRNSAGLQAEFQAIEPNPSQQGGWRKFFGKVSKKSIQPEKQQQLQQKGISDNAENLVNELFSEFNNLSFEMSTEQQRGGLFHLSQKLQNLQYMLSNGNNPIDNDLLHSFQQEIQSRLQELNSVCNQPDQANLQQAGLHEKLREIMTNIYEKICNIIRDESPSRHEAINGHPIQQLIWVKDHRPELAKHLLDDPGKSRSDEMDAIVQQFKKEVQNRVNPAAQPGIADSVEARQQVNHQPPNNQVQQQQPGVNQAQNLQAEQVEIASQEAVNNDKVQLLTLWGRYAQAKSLEDQLAVLEDQLAVLEGQPLNLQAANNPEIAVELQEIDRKKALLTKLIDLKNNPQQFVSFENHTDIEGFLEKNYSVDQPAQQASQIPDKYRERGVQGRRFYHETQTSAKSTCGVHVMNAFLGGPFFTIQAGNNFVCNKMMQQEAFKTWGEETIRGLFDLRGGDSGLHYDDVVQLLQSKEFNCKKMTNLRSELVNQGDRNQNLVLQKLEAQDRIIIGKQGGLGATAHFSCLRKDKVTKKWHEINSLSNTQGSLEIFDSIHDFVSRKITGADVNVEIIF